MLIFMWMENLIFEFSFTFYQQISLDKLLNAKYISVEYIKERNFWTNLP